MNQQQHNPNQGYQYRPQNVYPPAQQYATNPAQQQQTQHTGQQSQYQQSQYQQQVQHPSKSPIPPQRTSTTSISGTGHGPIDPQLMAYFNGVDLDKSGKINVTELHQALRNGNWQPYALDTLHILMQMFDKDRTGEIDFFEFQNLWKYLGDWQRCFLKFDVDGSGVISQDEIRAALKAFGYNISEKVAFAAIRKHSLPGADGVSFDKFIKLCVTIKTFTDAFAAFDTDQDGWVNFCYEDVCFLKSD